MSCEIGDVRTVLLNFVTNLRPVYRLFLSRGDRTVETNVPRRE